MTSTDDGVGDNELFSGEKVQDVATPPAAAGPLAAIGTLSSTDNESEVCPGVVVHTFVNVSGTRRRLDGVRYVEKHDDHWTKS